MEKAVVDRIEEGQAVILVGEAEDEVVLPVAELPGGTGEGVWLRIERDGERVVQVQLDPEETERASERIRQKLERLRGRGRSR